MPRRTHRHSLTLLLLAWPGFIPACLDEVPDVAIEAAPLIGVAPVTLAFASSEAALERGADERRFDFGSLRDLWIRVHGLPLLPITRVEAKMIAPNGDAFRIEQVWFAASRLVTTITVPAVPHPVSVRWPKWAGRGFAFDFPVAVAGTDFLRVPQPGRWTVSVRGSGWWCAVEATLDVEVRP